MSVDSLTLVICVVSFSQHFWPQCTLPRTDFLPTTSQEKGKKRRISEMFGKNKDKDLAAPAPPLNHHASNSTGVAADSAYASSDGPSSKRNSRADIVPMEHTQYSRPDGIPSNHRNLAVNTTNGDVLDDDTGEVVSTVSTMTGESDNWSSAVCC